MASSSLNPFVNNTVHQALVLKSTSPDGAVFMVGGRALGAPYEVQQIRKVNSNSLSNDHSIIRLTRKEVNTSTGKLATLQVTIDISIPKDVSVLTLAEQRNAVSLLVSLLNESSAMEATNANITSVLEGRDL
jgi:hypothetical protein